MLRPGQIGARRDPGTFRLLDTPMNVNAPRPGWKRAAIAAAIASTVLIATITAWRLSGQGDAKAKQDARPLVALIEARSQDMPVQLRSQGHVVAINEVEIRPQVEGVVRDLHFQEGAHVQAGQLLFSLDVGDKAAQLKRVRAQYAQTSAELTDARRNHARSEELVKSRYISSSALDATAAKVDVLQAQLQAARAEIESAQVLLDQARLVSPISGKAGSVAVRKGGLARPSDGLPLVRIVQMDPIAVEFALPEGEAGQVLSAAAAGQVAVSVTSEGRRVEGRLDFIDNTIDRSTGTLRMKAVFANADEHLLPGAFSQVELHAGTQRNVVVLPPQAVIEGPDGHFVYQVGTDGKALSRQVKLLRVQDGLAIVEGLRAGERIVVEGNREIRQGMAVNVAASRQAGQERRQ